MIERRILLVAGDPSVDRHGAALVRALKVKLPHVKVAALGGDQLKAVADRFIYPLVGVGGFGFWEPFFKLPQLLDAREIVESLLDEWKPDVVIPIDFYGFNIHIARMAKKAGIPVYYYISPQVWASRPRRIQELKKCVTEMLVLFPFEEKLYRAAGVPASFVGHPLTEQLPAPGQESAEPFLGLLPGSRRSVIGRHLPILIAAAQRLRSQIPQMKTVLFRPEEIEPAFYEEALREAPWIELTTDPGYIFRRQLWLAIGVSGTAALENMLLGIPMIIMYRLSRLTYEVAKRLIRVPFIGIPNLLAGRLVVPEFIQDLATPEKLAAAAAPLLHDAVQRMAQRQQLLALRQTLESGGSARAADRIIQHASL
jgi:lipid-A-disaccharide synthase